MENFSLVSRSPADESGVARLTVLQLISSSGVYGAERMLLSLCAALGGSGHRPVLGVFENSRNPNRELAEAARATGVDVITVPCRNRFDPRAVLKLTRIIRELRPGVVHTHGYKANLYGYAATRIARAPLVATCHNWTAQTGSVKLYEKLDRAILPRFDRVIAVSETVASVLAKSGVPLERSAVIRNGVEVERFAQAAPSLRAALPASATVVIGMVGRLVPEKGFQDVIEIAPRILSECPGALFLIIGEGPARSALEQLSRRRGVESKFQFLGYRPDMAGVLASLDILVLPSRNEGWPMTVLEAMAAGSAVVASAVGGLPLIIEHGSTGLLVTSEDCDGLAESILRLIQNEDLRRGLILNARRKLESTWTASAMAANYTRAYEASERRRLDRLYAGDAA